MSDTHTHATISCALLDARAQLPPEEQIERVPDVFDRYRIQTRRAQIHLEMRMELLRAEDAQEAAAISAQPGR